MDRLDYLINDRMRILLLLNGRMEKVDGAVELMLNGNIDEAMNRYNTKVSR